MATIRVDAGRSFATLLAVQDALRRRPVVTLAALSEAAGVSFPTAAKAVERLRALGIVAELTGGRRNRIFADQRYPEILNEGMEPL